MSENDLSSYRTADEIRISSRRLELHFFIGKVLMLTGDKKDCDG
jgi:hypothetical protein